MGQVIVRPLGIGKEPLLVTDKAHIIEFRDKEGKLMCFMPRLFPDGPGTLWGFCSVEDSDFDTMCERFGVTK